MIPLMVQPSKIPEIGSLPCRDKTLLFRRMPLVMGIVNVTPDSFSDGGRFFSKDRAVAHALRLVEEGADLIDVGGESTRPGSDPVSVDEELERVIPVLEELIGRIPVPISIDTRRAAVAEEALRLGCHLVNDVSACRDPEMAEVLRRHRAPVVLMHMKGEPKTMQESPSYQDVVAEVTLFLRERAALLQRRGVPRGMIVVDPGIGFGKRFRDNLELLKNLDRIKAIGYPVLIGASRKRFLGELLDAPVEGRLHGSLAAAAHCYYKGAEMIRVHDVAPTVELLRVLDALNHPDQYRADW